MIIRFPPIVWLLHLCFMIILRLPWFKGGDRILFWILEHTPADENERK